MTDAPDPLAEGEAERGTRRTTRAGDGGGSPVGSTLSIVLAVIAVIAGFLILRAITDDDGSEAGGVAPEETGSTPVDGSGPAGSGATSPSSPTSTTQPEVRTGAVVVVANASGVPGSAGAMTTVLEGAGFTMGTAGNTTEANLSTSIVYYATGDTAAQAVARTVAKDMGGLSVEEMPTPPPFDGELGNGTVLVMVGTDTANKTLADLAPATPASAPAPAGDTTTTAG